MNPRPLTEQQQHLIKLYSQCQFGMTPQRFYSKWQVNQEVLALICSRDLNTVRRWFVRGKYYRRPAPVDLRNLAIMDFLLEHFQEIPEKLWNLICPPNREQ